MQVHQFEAFIVLAEELNYRRAADRLSMSQPGLSEQIRNLEQQLGAHLFTRDRSGTRLTEQGQQLVPLAAAAVAAVNDLVMVAHGTHPEPGPGWPRRLRVGLLADGIGEQTWQLLRAFNAARPDVEITVKQLSFGDAFRAIDLGLADVVMATGPATPTAKQKVTTVGCEPIAALMTHGNPLAARSEVDLELVARRLTFDTPDGIDPTFRRFWLQQPLRDGAGRDVTTLREPPDGTQIPVLTQRFGRVGAIGLWPARLPVPASAGGVVKPLDRPLHAPQQILTDTRNDHGALLLRLVDELGGAQACPTHSCIPESWPGAPARPG